MVTILLRRSPKTTNPLLEKIAYSDWRFGLEFDCNEEASKKFVQDARPS